MTRRRERSLIGIGTGGYGACQPNRKGDPMPHQLIDGVELYYEDTGGSGDVVLFHHGYTGSHDSWPPIVEQLRARFRCVLMDGRGAGDSAHPDGGYSIEQYATDVIGMADALGIASFTFVGHSMGGGIGMWLGLEHAARLDRLVLVAPVGSGGIHAPAAVRQANARLWYERDTDELVRQRLVGAARPERVDETTSRVRVARALSVSQGHYEGSWDSMVAFSVTGRLGEITTPTLLIAGAADGLCPANLDDYRRLPNATLHVFSRVGHYIPTDVPDELAAVLGDFLEHGVVTAATLQERVAAGATR